MTDRAQGAAGGMSHDEAVIVGAEIVAGHDGSAELMVTLRHVNGAEAPVVLEEAAGLRLMQACGVAHLEGLAGRSWRKVLEGLQGAG